MKKLLKYLIPALILVAIVLPATMPVPVVADSPLTVQPPSKDTYLWSAIPDESNSAYNLIISDEVGFTGRLLLEFSLSGVPEGVTIASATLSLNYYYGDIDPVGKTVWAYKLARTDWIEGVNENPSTSGASWNDYKIVDSTHYTWTTSGGDYVTSSPSGTGVNMPGSYGWVDWNVLSIVQDAYDNSDSAEFLVKFATEGLPSETASRVGFYSAEGGDSTSRPKLVITYVGAPTVTTDAASSVATTTARLNSAVVNDGGGDVTIRFGWGLTSEAAIESYDHYDTVDGTFNTGEHPYLDVDSLADDTLHYFRVEGTNGHNATLGAELSFTTEEIVNGPSDFNGVPTATTVSLTWAKGAGATNTLIRYSPADYPDATDSGVLVYLDASSSYQHTDLTPGTTYYYSAWGESGEVYSDDYDTLMITTSVEGGGGDALPPPTIPSRWLSAPDYTNLSGLLFVYDAVNDSADALDMPRETLWMLLGISLCVTIGALMYLTTRRNALVGFISLSAALFFGWIIEIIPLWIPLVSLIMIVSLSIGHREVQQG